jgi:hypothetical protein
MLFFDVSRKENFFALKNSAEHPLSRGLTISIVSPVGKTEAPEQQLLALREKKRH